MQVAAETLYHTRRNILLKVLLSSYDQSTNCEPYPHFNNRKQYISPFQIISNFHIGQIDGEVIVIFRSSNQEQFWKSDVLKS